jgi:hypothetical protein
MIVMVIMPVSTMTRPPVPVAVQWVVAVIIMIITITAETPMATLPQAW